VPVYLSIQVLAAIISGHTCDCVAISPRTFTVTRRTSGSLCVGLQRQLLPWLRRWEGTQEPAASGELVSVSYESTLACWHHQRSLIYLLQQIINSDETISVAQVAAAKFHTAVLTSTGEVFTCGFGAGGRLGRGDEATYLSFNCNILPIGISCTAVAVGRCVLAGYSCALIDIFGHIAIQSQ